MKIKELMEQQNLQYTQVAEAMGVSCTAVFKWANDQAYPSADKLPALADLFECSIDQLFGRDEAGQTSA